MGAGFAAFPGAVNRFSLNPVSSAHLPTSGATQALPIAQHNLDVFDLSWARRHEFQFSIFIICDEPRIHQRRPQAHNGLGAHVLRERD